MIDPILSHKTHLSKCERVEIIQHILSDHNGIKLEINTRKITGKLPKLWTLHDILSNTN